MAELLQTERTYVKDIETCIRVWFIVVFFLNYPCKTCMKCWILSLMLAWFC